MVARDDLQACLQAYQFAELILGGFLSKNERDRQQALQAAERLREGVQEKYEALTSRGGQSINLEALLKARAKLDEKLNDARARSV